MSDYTPTPWFVSGVRFRMNGGEWLSINRYDEAKKQDENIACVGYDPRNGLGQADAAFIVKAVNNHAILVRALEEEREYWAGEIACAMLRGDPSDAQDRVDRISRVLDDLIAPGHT